MSKQTIIDDGSIGKYAVVIPHMAGDDLNPFQYRLYAHYKKLYAIKGGCEESVRETAKATHMSSKTITAARNGLAALGYISQDIPTKAQARKGQTVHVTLIDRWAENMARYAKIPVVDLPQGVVDLPQGVVDLPQEMPYSAPKGVVDLLRIDSLIRRDPLIKNNTKTLSPKPQDPMFDAIAKTWKTRAGGFVGLIRSMVLGVARKGEWKECNFEPPAQPEEILLFGGWWNKHHADLTIPSDPTKIQRYFYQFRAARARYQAQITPVADEKIEPMPADANEYIAALLKAMGRIA